jgi:hypothetical protein
VQTGDTPTNQFVNVSTYEALRSADIAIGAAIAEHINAPGKEYIFCYRPTSDQRMGASLMSQYWFHLKADLPNTKATIDSTQSNRSGFCDLEKIWKCA